MTVNLPETASLPDQAPEARHEVAWLDDQVSVLLPPGATEVALADRATVGGWPSAGVTATVVELAGDLPVEFEHVIV